MVNLDKIKKFIDEGLLNNVFPGCAAGFISQSEKYTFFAGFESHNKKVQIKADTFFDLASLSKPLATVLAILTLINEGKIKFETTLDVLLGCPVPSDKKNINITQLLSHSSGLIAHDNYFKILAKYPLKMRKRMLLEFILKSPLQAPPGTTTLYSDIGFIILFYIIEYQSEMDFESYFYRWVLAPLNIKNIYYKPKEKGINYFSATEECDWRQKEMYGEVHDQNTYILGGVSGQAGLFGSLNATLSFVECINDMVQGRINHPNISKELIIDAVTCRLNPPNTCWGLGFDTPSLVGSSAGQYISSNSCGHLGFTGTSFWIDFDKDISAVLLTNRINPSINNLKIRDFRPDFHDLIFGNS